MRAKSCGRASARQRSAGDIVVRKNISEETIGEFQRFGKSGDRLFVARSAFDLNVGAFDIDFRDVPTGIFRPAAV